MYLDVLDIYFFMTVRLSLLWLSRLAGNSTTGSLIPCNKQTAILNAYVFLFQWGSIPDKRPKVGRSFLNALEEVSDPLVSVLCASLSDCPKGVKRHKASMLRQLYQMWRLEKVDWPRHLQTPSMPRYCLDRVIDEKCKSKGSLLGGRLS